MSQISVFFPVVCLSSLLVTSNINPGYYAPLLSSPNEDDDLIRSLLLHWEQQESLHLLNSLSTPPAPTTWAGSLIDLAYCSNALKPYITSCSVKNSTPEVSDHLAIIIRTKIPLPPKPKPLPLFKRKPLSLQQRIGCANEEHLSKFQDEVLKLHTDFQSDRIQENQDFTDLHHLTRIICKAADNTLPKTSVSSHITNTGNQM
eukprot:Lithocolla_globosa_v1_NODE_2008_length_2211_cov_7.663265.p2 type:complete len:202 gc:universal NODE_2008_length_2211_cov_7.663265:6-611(+)